MIRLSLLGQIALVASTGKRLTRVLAGDRRIGLVAYLALAMPRMRRRDTALGLFWPEATVEEGRHRLRQLLYILRSECGEDVVITAGREEIGLNPERVWCDAVAFEAAYRGNQLEVCSRLYGGLLCEGLFISATVAFERWMAAARERLHELAVDAAWRLAQQNEHKGQLLEACYWGREALRLDPDEERLRWMLGLYERRGDRVRALRLFDRFQHVLADELEIAPSPETIAVVERIRGAVAPAIAQLDEATPQH